MKLYCFIKRAFFRFLKKIKNIVATTLEFLIFVSPFKKGINKNEY